MATRVPTSALVEEEPPNRPITVATGVSVLLHFAVLLLIGIASVETNDTSTVPELRLHLEQEDGRDSEHDNAPATQSVAASTNTLSEESPAAIADNRSLEREPVSGAGAAAPPSAHTSSGDENAPVQAERPTRREPFTPDVTPVLATVGVSDFAAPLIEEEPQPVPQQLPIAESQQTMLTRSVLKGLRGLQDSGEEDMQLSWRHDGRPYTASITRQPAPDNTGLERLIVEVATEENGKRLRTQLQLKRLAFSHFTQLVDHWDENVQLHDDQIDGRFHSNSEIYLGYDRKVAPRFLGKVTTAAGGFTVANSLGRMRRDEIFRAGIQTRAGRISLPERFAPLSPEQGETDAEVWSFTEDTRVTFYSDGTYGWSEARKGSPEQRQAIARTQTFIIGARGKTLYVRGTVRGKVLVYSPSRIVIEGDLTYATNARSAPDSGDALGLVCDGIIEVAGPKVTGPGDLEIDAAVYARRRFVVTHELSRPSGTLRIFGSLTAGSLSATEPRYATNIEFDPRFEHLRPPGFPVTNRYEVESWDARWVAEDLPAEPPHPEVQATR